MVRLSLLVREGRDLPRDIEGNRIISFSAGFWHIITSIAGAVIVRSAVVGDKF